MASTRDLRRRIVSVQTTQQTTKAMKMVSAAKLRRSQEAIVRQRPYARKIQKLIGMLAGGQVSEHQSRYFETAAEENSGAKTALVFVVTSDRGLCGGFNSSVIKAVRAWLNENEKKYSKVELGFVGRRGRDYFKLHGRVKAESYFREVGNAVKYPAARAMADHAVNAFLAGEVTDVFVCYNEFKNAISQKVVVERFLPVEKATATGGAKESEASLDAILVKPSAPELLDSLLEKYFGIQAFRMLLESQASEHGARMSAMDNATRNASEMIQKLKLKYNKQRQAGITQELLEIIAGSEATKS